MSGYPTGVWGAFVYSHLSLIARPKQINCNQTYIIQNNITLQYKRLIWRLPDGARDMLSRYNSMCHPGSLLQSRQQAAVLDSSHSARGYCPKSWLQAERSIHDPVESSSNRQDVKIKQEGLLLNPREYQPSAPTPSAERVGAITSLRNRTAGMFDDIITCWNKDSRK